MDKKYPLALRIIRTLFPMLERIAPHLAARWAVKLFLTPVRQNFIPGEKDFLQHTEHFDIRFGDSLLHGYRMGEGPEIVCVHGWSGRAAQFRYIAAMVVEAGYSFVAFDAPGHGQNPGKRTHLFEFAAVFQKVLPQCKQPVAVIGHSLGAAAVSYATASRMVQIPAFIAMGAPVVADDILEAFRQAINGSELVARAIRKRSLEVFDKTFDSVAMEQTFAAVECPVLAIHGERDFDVPVRHLDVLQSIRPSIRVLRVVDAGHRRILKKEQALEAILAFIRDPSGA